MNLKFVLVSMGMLIPLVCFGAEQKKAKSNKQPSREEMIPVLDEAAKRMMDIGNQFWLPCMLTSNDQISRQSAVETCKDIQARCEKLKRSLAEQLCVVCAKRAHNRCADCHIASYCSQDCQKKDWKQYHGRGECVIYKISDDMHDKMEALRAFLAKR